MVSRASRLPREDFQAKDYKTIRTPFFLVKTKKNDAGHPRMGVVVGKAIIKQATKRNFWKRQAKSIITKNARGNNDFLIIFSSHKAVLTKQQFKEDLELAINKTQ